MASIIQLPRKHDPKRFLIQAAGYAIAILVLVRIVEAVPWIKEHGLANGVVRCMGMLLALGAMQCLFRAIFGYRPRTPGTE